MQKKIIILIACVSIIILISALLYVTQRSQENEDLIRVSGNIEITEVEVSFKIPGRVEKRVANEGEAIQAGQLVAVLDSLELEKEVSLRQAELEASQANLLELKKGYLPEEISQAKARLDEARSDYQRHRIDFDRQKKLFSEEVISTKEFETSKNSYQVSQARLQNAEQYYSLLKKGIRVEKIQAAEAHVKTAQENLDIAKLRLSYANLYSPLSGFVLTKNVENGEYVAAGMPVVTVGNLKDVWLRAYIDETLLGSIQLGQKVTVHTDTYQNKTYGGEVVFISQEAEFTPKNVQTEKERVKLVYRIKINIPNPTLELKPGMPADGVIHFKKA